MLKIAGFLYQFRSKNKDKNTRENYDLKYDTDGSLLYPLIRYSLFDEDEENVALLQQNEEKKIEIKNSSKKNNIKMREINELISGNDHKEVENFPLENNIEMIEIELLPLSNNIEMSEIDHGDVATRIAQLNTEKRFVVWLLSVFYYIDFTHNGNLAVAHLDYLEGKVTINDILIDDEKGALAYAIQNIDRTRMGYKTAGIVSVFVMLGLLIVVGSLIAEHFLDDVRDVDYSAFHPGI